MDKLNYRCDNPGAVQFGNFINYYQFHPPEERIQMLNFEIWTPFFENKNKGFFLDIGCNSGNLSISLYNFFTKHLKINNIEFLGVDIDPTLITRAREQNNNENIQFQCLDIMLNQDFLKNYLKIHQTPEFNVVFCFSVSMWIHLNHGDEGLKNFLKHISELGEIVIIEPQPWKCYRTAVKRLKLGNSEFPQFKQLQIRQNVEEEIEKFIITYCNMEKFYESAGRTKWGRKLLFFKKRK